MTIILKLVPVNRTTYMTSNGTYSSSILYGSLLFVKKSTEVVDFLM
jgi:hypothetical protein